nr:uncharacterized protein LOC111421477 [Onthophagus taurus]
MDESWFDQFGSDDTNTEDGDDYIPSENEVEDEVRDEYDTDDSDVDFIDQETREAAVLDSNVLFLSKDKTIQYSRQSMPIARSNSSTSFASKQGPTPFATARISDTLSAFLLFIEPFENTVVEMTNLYGVRRYREKWLAVDVTTMRAYYGLLLLAGVYRSKGECIEEL